MLTCLVPILFTFYIQDVLKLKKNNSGAKVLIFILILGSIFFAKYSTEQPQKIGQIFLKVSGWIGYNEFETDFAISFTDKKK